MSIVLNDNINQLYQLQQTMVKKVPNSPEEPVVSDNSRLKREETPKEYHRRKNGVALCTALGIATSLALLSKFDKNHKYSLSPKKIADTKLKDTYLGKVDYRSKQVIGTGIGSCLGGFIGGALFDKREDSNLSLKAQEAIVQVTNISLPIVFVEALSNVGDCISKGMGKWASKGGFLRKTVAASPKFIGSMVGLVTGMYIGNKASNKLNKKLFKDKEEDRPVQLLDFSAHIDDICLAATFIAQNNPITKCVSKIIPLALSVAGCEVGNKSSKEEK